MQKKAAWFVSIFLKKIRLLYNLLFPVMASLIMWSQKKKWAEVVVVRAAEQVADRQIYTSVRLFGLTWWSRPSRNHSDYCIGLRSWLSTIVYLVLCSLFPLSIHLFSCERSQVFQSRLSLEMCLFSFFFFPRLHLWFSLREAASPLHSSDGAGWAMKKSLSSAKQSAL